MLKVYLKAFLNKNLGDDLFVKVITDRYKNSFTSLSIYKYPKLNNNLKLKTPPRVLFKVLNRLSSIFKVNHPLEQILINKQDIVVVIGGSIFMEPKNSKINPKTWYSNLSKPYYILGSNIGPYYTNDYLNNLKEIFMDASVVSLRDTKSYNLFQNLPNIEVHPDIIFSLDVSKYFQNSSKRVVISVIDCYQKGDQIPNVNPEAYEQTIKELIDYFDKLGYGITLMSFCETEGDLNAINRILKLTGKKDIEVYSYQNNIDEALKVLSNSEIIVGTRFHAVVLGFLLNKVVLPIIYNDKTTNLLKDLNFKGPTINIEDIENFKITSLNKENLTYKIDVTNLKKEAQKHFTALDKILDRRRYNEK